MAIRMGHHGQKGRQDSAPVMDEGVHPGERGPYARAAALIMLGIAMVSFLIVIASVILHWYGFE
jgi:hypothetical protein